MIHLPHERLSRLRAELEQLIQRRDRLDAAGADTHRADVLIEAKRRSLEKLEQVAADLERLKRRRAS